MWRLANAWDMRKVKEKCEFTVLPTCALIYIYIYITQNVRKRRENEFEISHIVFMHKIRLTGLIRLQAY